MPSNYWWLQRSNVQISVSHSATGLVSLVRFTIASATDPNTTLNWFSRHPLFCDLKVNTNGVSPVPERLSHRPRTSKVQVGNTVTNTLLTYYPLRRSPIYS